MGDVLYMEGDQDETITGRAILWEDASNTLRPVNASKPLPVGDATTGAALGTTTDAPASASADEDTTARTGISLWKGIKNLLIDIVGLLPASIGQKAKAASLAVTLASDEDDLGVETSGATIAQTPTVTAGAYSAGDAVGGLLTFANAARASGGGGVVKGVVIVDDAGQDAELELWLFDRTFTAMVDNAAWAPSEANLENLLAVISTEDSAQGWLAAGTPSAIDIEVARRYDLSGTSLFGQLVTRGTPTFAATDDVTVKVALLQD